MVKKLKTYEQGKAQMADFNYRTVLQVLSSPVSNYNENSVLIVDDEPDIRFLLRKALAPRIALIEEAGNGEEALEIIYKSKIDLIITDLNMPYISGLTLLKEVSVKFPNIISMILTAYGDKESILEALSYNVYDFLEKPIDLSILVHRVDRALEMVRNKSLLVSAAREFAMQFFKNKDDLAFDELSIADQNKLLTAALGLIKIKELNSKSKIKKAGR